jgi:AraC-like DNA-binding protein
LPIRANVDITALPISQRTNRLGKPGKDIHLVRAAYLRQFTRTMQANGIDAVQYYRRVKLPTTEPDDPESLLPEIPFWRLVNLVAREESIPDFGAQVGKAFPWHSVVSLEPFLSQCNTLGELIVTFCKVASGQSSHVQFDLEQINGKYWFAANGTPLIRNDIQMELYRVTCMAQMIQLSTGSGWRPENVRLSMPSTNLKTSCPLINQSAINFSSGQTAIEIPDIAIDLPVRLKIPDSQVDLNKYDINANFLNSLRLILEIYIAHGDYKFAAVANAVGIPARTLQRRLNALGTSFSELLGETRFEIAKTKLKRKAWSIQRISAELGYSDDAHFVRAFKGWSGMTPGEFKKTAIHQHS